MRRLPLILGLVLIAGLTVHDIYEFFITNAGVRYFSSEPKRLVYVMLLGAAGGVVALGISRMSPISQRRLKLFALGGFGALLVAGAAFFGLLFQSHVVAEQLDGLGWVWVAWAMAAGMVWIEFRQVWRQSGNVGEQ